MKTSLYIIILSILFSCQKKEIKKPNNFIEKNKMINLILDMKIAEKSRTIPTKNKKRNINYMSFVYEKYNVDSTQFKENNNYYIENLELYEEIYNEVNNRLKDSVKKYERLKKEKDSIAKKNKKDKLKLKNNKTSKKDLKISKKK